MEFETFHRLVEKRKTEKPALFVLEHDRLLSAEEMARQENIHHIRIPEAYRRFLLQYGGGYFGFVNAYSLDCGSCFFIPNHLDEAPPGWLPISDNGCGDVFLLNMREGGDREPVYLWEHEAKEIQATQYSDVYEYLLKAGLSVDW